MKKLFFPKVRVMCRKQLYHKKYTYCYCLIAIQDKLLIEGACVDKNLVIVAEIKIFSR